MGMAEKVRDTRELKDFQAWSRMYPQEGTGLVPVEPYIAPEYYEREREKVFKRVWLMMGREISIPRAGDYFVRELAVANTSVLVIRGNDGKVRAFHNACSHRLNKLAWETRGSAKALTCKFHGWSYALDGRLIGVPMQEMFFDFRPEEHGLTALATESWAGFIFVNLDPSPKESLREYLGEVGSRLEGYPFDAIPVPHASWQLDLRCNWKVVRDAFMDSYHGAFLHKRTSRFRPGTGIADTWQNAIPWPLKIELLGRHSMLSFPKTGQRHFNTSKAGALEPPPMVNPTRSPVWAWDAYPIFPNFILQVSGTYFSTFVIWPLGPDRARFEATRWLPKAATAQERFMQEYAKWTFHAVASEDASTVEATQEVLASGAKKHFILGDSEIQLRHVNRVLEEMLA